MPQPAAITGNPDEQAARLAALMLAGGDEGVRALVQALQKSGFPVRDAEGRIVLQPAGQSQGIAFELWEVNALADLVADRKQVTAPLDSVAEILASPLQELKGAPLADLLLAGVRRNANGTDSALSFWSLIIVELGRQARHHEPYDLLGAVDPKQTYLDSIQMAFITKRLSADITALAHPDKARTKAALIPQWSLIPPAFAAAPPCRFDGAEAEITDWAATLLTSAFGELLDYLKEQGLTQAERLATIVNFANVLAAYTKLAISLAAFDIHFELQGESPLIRTTDLQPTAGEKRTVVTTVRMDTDNVQWMNCFRMVLNAAGVDFNVESNGPIAGAAVSWRGIAGFNEVARYSGGPEQIVRFVGDPGQRIQEGGSFGGNNAVLNQPTDKDGKARIDVEGVGQRRALGSEPKPVMKEATLGAQVVLKPANIYRDLKDAVALLPGGVSGLLTIPAEMLYRTTWAFGGTYTFPVQDWIEGNGWAGTFTYTRTDREVRSGKTQSICCGGRPIYFTRESESETINSQRWEIQRGQAELLSPGFTMATAEYSLSGSQKHIQNSSNTGWASCRGGGHPQTFTAHHRAEHSQVAYSGMTEVTIRVDDDGTLMIASAGPNSQPVGETQVTTADERNDGCNGTRPAKTETSTSQYRPGNWGVNIEATYDPAHGDALNGSLIRIDRFGQTGATIRHVYQWNLRR